MDNNTFVSMVSSIYTNMNNVLIDEESRNEVVKISGDSNGLLDETFFTAELIAFYMQFNKLTGKNEDLLDFIAILNKLAFQYLRDKE